MPHNRKSAAIKSDCDKWYKSFVSSVKYQKLKTCRRKSRHPNHKSGEIAKTENMSTTKLTPKSQADRLTLVEEEMLFLKEVPDTVRFLKARVKKLSGKVVEIDAHG